jgi:hypothetical protein
MARPGVLIQTQFGALGDSRGDDPPFRRILQPFDKRECINLKEAADIAGKSESTMRGWADEHGLGRRVGGGTWSISRVALAMFLDDDKKALRAYHAGDRTSELVASYFRSAAK